MKNKSRFSSSDFESKDTDIVPNTFFENIERSEKICVIGAGFVGTVTAAGFAKFGHDVICVEKDPKKVSMLNKGQIPFYEKDLEELLNFTLSNRKLEFTTDLEHGIRDRKAIFITVGTPPSNNGRADISDIVNIINDISHNTEFEQIIVLKSTVPVGTANNILNLLNQNGSKNKNLSIINNPEFLREGNAVFDFFNPNRIVIGGDSPNAIETIKNIYRKGLSESFPIITTNNETAEMIKYASNVFLATKLGFVNELAKLCEQLGLNTLDITKAMGLDPRVGKDFLNPGPGWGGSCLPKDLKEFIGLADSLGVSMLIPQAVKKANENQFSHVVDKVRSLLNGDIKDKKIAVMGLAFKANTSDLRESPAIPIIDQLIKEGAYIRAYDPAVQNGISKIFTNVKKLESPYETAVNTDCIVILTEWSEFEFLDWQKIGSLVTEKNIVDARNILNVDKINRLGFKYLSVGQGSEKQQSDEIPDINFQSEIRNLN